MSLSNYYWITCLSFDIAFTYSSIMTLGTVLGVIGNTFVILAVFTKKELNFEGNLFVVNLALADICVAGFVNTMNIVGILEGEIFFLKMPAFCYFIGSTCLTSCITSLFNMCAIGINRYIFIVRNNLYRKIFTRKKCYAYCVLTWFLGIISHQIATLLGWGGHFYDRKSLACVYNRLADYTFTLYCAGFILSLPAITTAYCYVRIYLFWRQVSMKVATMSKKNKTNQTNSMKLARMLFILYFIFIVCWLPYGLVVNIDRQDKLSPVVHILVVILAHLNSAINPILYGLSNQHFKEAYINILRKMLCMKKIIRKETENTASLTL